MTIVTQSITSTTYAARTNTVIAAPASVALGDLLRLNVVTAIGGGDNPPDPTPPAGFSALPNPGVGTWPMTTESGGFTLEWRPYYKFADSGDVTLSASAGSYTVTHAACSSQATLKRITGANATTPFPDTPTAAIGTGSTSTAASLTTTIDSSLIEFCGFDFSVAASNIPPPTGTTPTFTERFEATLMYDADGPLLVKGATGDKTITNHNPGSEPWGAALVAIAPGTSGTTYSRGGAIVVGP